MGVGDGAGGGGKPKWVIGPSIQSVDLRACIVSVYARDHCTIINNNMGAGVFNVPLDSFVTWKINVGDIVLGCCILKLAALKTWYLLESFQLFNSEFLPRNKSNLNVY